MQNLDAIIDAVVAVTEDYGMAHQASIKSESDGVAISDMHAVLRGIIASCIAEVAGGGCGAGLLAAATLAERFDACYASIVKTPSQGAAKIRALCF